MRKSKPDLNPLYQWYAREHRKLPFRETRDPYRIWVSEIMLQQTRVAAMLERYNQFIRRFPNIESLAKSSEEEVVLMWQGLGYYSRAKNLRKGAQLVTERWRGKFPDTKEEALLIPGIGDYTASAVLSISHNSAYAAFDGNVRRVTARLFYPEAQNDRAARKKAQEVLSGAEPGMHNQAMMELGAVICVPGLPACDRCPISADCNAFSQGGRELAARIPAKQKKEKLEVQMDFYSIEQGERVILVQDPEARFLPGHWMFPSRLRMTGIDRVTPGFSGVVLREALGTIKHTITKHSIAGHLWRAGPPFDLSRVSWREVRKSELRDVLASSLGLKLARLIPET
ncbi:MAG TPA: A/G-specific adenine glycosylase [Leptospiraceae bacterium]|nr:A/G-specific adenine glycosylase [Leptospirales bacterium]HMW58282.1 A/G-specific adenine glycosylase [Leptospiraceae bacterium]HMX57351.1 A/G-specific adenine glycosylase [Leptospiraceae bacterium]HMY45695.1 A/G-specific adenine glycosylase [Leptospiraceae bacterium]HMZ35258.1 A/G-specific adenine glycosylase [Leptospiraceae bacterium]